MAGKKDISALDSKGSLAFDGFTFEGIRPEASPDAGIQKAWIDLESGSPFHSQPYEQMAATFRTMGLQEAASQIMMEKNRAAGPDAIGLDIKLCKEARADFIRHMTGWTLSSTPYDYVRMVKTAVKLVWDFWWYNLAGPAIGFGYRPWHAAVFSVLLILFGACVFQKG